MVKKILILICFLTVLFNKTKAQNFSQLENIGDFVSCKISDSIVIIKTKTAEIQFTAYKDQIIRVNISKTALKKMQDSSFAVVQDSLVKFKNCRELAKSVLIATDSLTISVSKYPIRINFYRKGGVFLNGDQAQFGVTWMGGTVQNYRFLGKNERFIGLSNQQNIIDKRGQTIRNNSNTKSATTSQIPFYISLNNGQTYGLFLDNSFNSTFDFGASNDDKFISIDAESGNLNYYFFGAQSVNQIIRDYTWLTGKGYLPPLWSLGNQQMEINSISDTSILASVKQFRKKQIPLEAISLDFPTLLEAQEAVSSPKFKNTLDSLKALNIKTILSLSPWVNVHEGNTWFNEGIKKKVFASYPSDENFIIKAANGEKMLLPSFNTSNAIDWWNVLINKFQDASIAGFENRDHLISFIGAPLPRILKFGKNYYPEFGNLYGLQMAKATFKKENTGRNNRILNLSHDAYAGIQRYAGIVTDHLEANDEAMFSSLGMISNLGLMGINTVATDIGGSLSNPSPELMVRWNSIGIYTPLLKKNNTLLRSQKTPWEYGSIYENIIKTDLQTRYKLLPYLYATWYQSTQTGVPIVRNLAIDYSWDENIFDSNYQHEFLFGNQMLICPIGATNLESNVYLPKGSWYRLSTDSLYQGSRSLKVATPLNDLPVFIKAGAIIPLQNATENTAATSDGILKLHIWKGEGIQKFKYYEDDGQTLDYQKGEFLKKDFIFDFNKNELTISKSEGSYLSKFQKIEVILHGFSLQNKTAPTFKLTNSNKAGFNNENIQKRLEMTLNEQKIQF